MVIPFAIDMARWTVTQKIAFASSGACAFTVAAFGIAIGPLVHADDVTRRRFADDVTVGAVLASTSSVYTVVGFIATSQ